MTLSPYLSEADHCPPQAGHQKEGILSDALFLVREAGLEYPQGTRRCAPSPPRPE